MGVHGSHPERQQPEHDMILKHFYQTLAVILLVCSSCLSKICWKECTPQNIIKSVDLVGCHRRSSYPESEDFRCPLEEGNLVKGPPCTAKKGDTFKLHVEFDNLTISDMTQYAWWEAGTWLPDIPWVTMDKEGCPWLDNGKGCNNETMQGGSKYLVMPIPVDPLYPAGYFNIKHSFYERFPSGEEKEVACFRFNFKIV